MQRMKRAETDPVTGQKYPEEKPEPNYGEFWPFIFKNMELSKNSRIKIDWDKWQDEDQDKDMIDEMNPEKLIELMKKNGEWSDEEDQFCEASANG